MLHAKNVVEWFIYNNPELSSGYIDENTKLNKLVYFSNLMYHCVTGQNLVDDQFIAFPNGPVVSSIYRDYRYNGLNRIPEHVIDIDGEQLRILNIVNCIYASLSTEQLVQESHTHSLWKNVEDQIPNNPVISFDHINPELIEYYRQVYAGYASIDFSNIVKEKINDNVFYYFKNSFDMTEEVVSKLSTFKRNSEPMFLQMIDGELVVS